jgi:hypothetical protein
MIDVQWIKVRQFGANQQARALPVRRMGAIAGAAFLLAVATSCASQPVNVSASPTDSEGALGNATVTPTTMQPSSLMTLKPVPVPNLIPATTVPERLPEVTTGRPDPFATLLMSPTKITRIAPPAAIAPSLISPSLAPPMVPAPVTAALPVPRTLPAFQPTVGSLGAPAAPPISAAQAIEVSGVVQAGSTTSIIIKAPDERTSRYVSVGDRLANGRVLVKRVEMGAEPVVILEQDGAEVIKAIGTGGLVGAL